MKKAFTLIELLIAMAIAAILFSVTVPAYKIYKEKSEISKGKTAALQICEGINYSLSRCNGVYKKGDIKDAVDSLTSMAEDIGIELNASKLTISYKCDGRTYMLNVNTMDSSYVLYDSCNKNLLNSKL